MAWMQKKPEALVRLLRNWAAIAPKAEGLDMIIYAAGILHGTNMKPRKAPGRILQAVPSCVAMAVNASGFPDAGEALLPWLRHKRAKSACGDFLQVGGIGNQTALGLVCLS